METAEAPVAVAPSPTYSSEAVRSSPAPLQNSEKPPISSSAAFVVGFAGVAIPMLTLILEAVFHLCAGVFFDPLPSWWHVALVGFVPLANSAVLVALLKRQTHSLRALSHVNAIAIGISFIYSILFLPMSPFAVLGIAWLGFGLLPLAPLLALAGALILRRRLNLFAGSSNLPRWHAGVAAGVAALALPYAHALATHELIRRSLSDDVERSRSALPLLRTFGSSNALLTACYPQKTWLSFLRELTGFSMPSAAAIPVEDAQEIYFRVTGRPFNSVRAPGGVISAGRGMWNFDRALGGSQVADKVPGLSLISSTIEGRAETSGSTSYVEWTMVFKNVAANASEARAQIELPPGGVVSRLTLWINGEPREAAFGGVSQVRGAYQEVAVAQRRDPVLVTTSGPGRVLMQCFPVPPGGEMKVRVGITAPLQLRSETERAVLLPRILETNYEQPAKLAHELTLHIVPPSTGPPGALAQKIESRLKEAELLARRPIPVPATAAAEAFTDDPSDPQFQIRQTLARIPMQRPGRVAFVFDGSRAMAPHLRTIAKALEEHGWGDGGHAAFFAGDEVREWVRSTGSLPGWLRSLKARGGRDNAPALAAAADFIAGEPGGVIVWVHGPQPVLLTSLDSLTDRLEKSAGRPLLYDLPVKAAPNRIIEGLNGLAHVRAVDVEADFSSSLKELLGKLMPEPGATEFVLQRERVSRTGANAGGNAAAADRHVARLWGNEEIERLHRLSDKASLDHAIKLALQLQLVTPVSGAVVLEEQEQYDRHGLSPIAPETAPTIPEPGSMLLLSLGAAWLAGRRRRAAGRG